MTQPYKPSEYLVKAIEENNARHIRNALVNEITFHPEFKNSEFDNALDYVRKMHQDGKIDNIEEPYCLQDGESACDADINSPDKSKWDKNYWGLLLAFLFDNFCPDKRVPKIKQVSQYVYSANSKQNAPTFKNNSNQLNNQQPGNPTQAPLKKTTKRINWGLIIATLVALIAMIAIIVTFVRKH